MVKTPQYSNSVPLKQPTLLVIINAFEHREVWQQLEVAAGFLPQQVEGREGREGKTGFSQ